ncbi:hypothetical protein [Alloacidobacterium sp.]|uniref:hypothetical protein n=1 Tax=Alloacidobacterium sp. TaxID=2951999 RepID=UPI002D4D591B|nr:hypothetical protein [Alloacidobacterium sp.]HYK38133.1 hypothetical protein [Alloacidobacterium sp.]
MSKQIGPVVGTPRVNAFTQCMGNYTTAKQWEQEIAGYSFNSKFQVWRFREQISVGGEVGIEVQMSVVHYS